MNNYANLSILFLDVPVSIVFWKTIYKQGLKIKTIIILFTDLVLDLNQLVKSLRVSCSRSDMVAGSGSFSQADGGLRELGLFMCVFFLPPQLLSFSLSLSSDPRENGLLTW